MGKIVAVLGDPSDHGGTLISTNQDGRYKLKGIPVCADGCSHSCPIPGHGVTSVSAVTTHSYVNGKLIITTGAVAGCGAKMTPPQRGHEVE
jgi:uncharacterized Zn-binding protein involved in type VI secretion